MTVGWAQIIGSLAALIAAVSAALSLRHRTQISGWVVLVAEMQRRLDDLHEAIVAAEGRITAATERAEAAEELAQDAQTQATQARRAARRARGARRGAMGVDRGGRDPAGAEHSRRAHAVSATAPPESRTTRAVAVRRVIPAPELTELVDEWRRHAVGRDPAVGDVWRHCAAELEALVTEDEEED
jgi:hypothetical protein